MSRTYIVAQKAKQSVLRIKSFLVSTALVLNGCAADYTKHSDKKPWPSRCLSVSLLNSVPLKVGDKNVELASLDYLRMPLFEDSSIVLMKAYKSKHKDDELVYIFFVPLFEDTSIVYVIRDRTIIDRFVLSSWRAIDVDKSYGKYVGPCL
jgi:hypothetical protein